MFLIKRPVSHAGAFILATVIDTDSVHCPIEWGVIKWWFRKAEILFNLPYKWNHNTGISDSCSTGIIIAIYCRYNGGWLRTQNYAFISNKYIHICSY